PYEIKDNKIMLSAINIQRNYQTINATGDVFWKIILKSKPQVKKSTLKFEYSKGGTTDSNIAGEDGQSDILKSVNQVSLNFEDQGLCGN
ncbi:hypothetical protein ACFL21_05470, partial [Patescibacteria group bacterium]